MRCLFWGENRKRINTFPGNQRKMPGQSREDLIYVFLVSCLLFFAGPSLGGLATIMET